MNIGSSGLLPVAVLTTANFDAADVDPTPVTLGNDDGNDTPVAVKRDSSLHASLEDVDLDGDVDLILHFDVQVMGANNDPDSTTTELNLNGMTWSAAGICGSDIISLVPGS